MKWQRIETAPRDGSYVLGFGPHKTRGTYIEVIHVYMDKWTIVWMEGYGEPTHWMPLPAAPTEEQQ
jgi:hypothetical protein